jgi:carboxymethylenebutenolidase
MPGQTTAILSPDGQRFTGFLSLPEKGSGPGLVLLQEIFGVNRVMRDAADLFAAEGYVVLVPDLFWRLQPGIDLDYTPENLQKGLAYAQKFDLDRAVADIGAAVRTLQGLPACRGQVAVVGFCLGGLLAYLAAARLDVAAAVGFYGGRIDQHLGEAGKVRCPLVLHFGGKDDHIAPEAVRKIRAAFGGREDVSVYVYPDAGHGFYTPGRPSYNRVAAQMAHTRTLEVLRRVLGPPYDLSALWDRHCEFEFDLRDVDATMRTMVAEPYVNHVPTMTGGVGFRDLYRFYKHHFLARLPKDTHIVPVSRTVGADRVVDELLFCFTHDCEVDFLLPGVPPTGKYVEVPTVAVVCFRGDKLYHEHIYWDQASVLVQIGLLDAKALPVAGIETARKLVDDEQPSNTLMKRWAESARPEERPAPK